MRTGHDCREAAIDIIRILERSVPTGNGVGPGMLWSYYCGSLGWYTFSKRERWAMEKTMAAFRDRLIVAGYLPGSGRG